jgi:hypothetical protein
MATRVAQLAINGIFLLWGLQQTLQQRSFKFACNQGTRACTRMLSCGNMCPFLNGTRSRIDQMLFLECWYVPSPWTLVFFWAGFRSQNILPTFWRLPTCSLLYLRAIFLSLEHICWMVSVLRDQREHGAEEPYLIMVSKFCRSLLHKTTLYHINMSCTFASTALHNNIN